MNKDNKLFRISLSIFLMLLAIVSVFIFIAVFISGPYLQEQLQEEDSIQAIATKHTCSEVDVHTFAYTTYACHNKQEVLVFDETGNQVASRDVEDVNYEGLDELLAQEASDLIGEQVHITYAYDEVVYMVEKGSEWIVVSFDDLEVLFYMKEGL